MPAHCCHAGVHMATFILVYRDAEIAIRTVTKEFSDLRMAGASIHLLSNCCGTRLGRYGELVLPFRFCEHKHDNFN